MAVELEVQEEGGDPQPLGEGREDGERQSSQTYFYYLALVVVVIGFASCVMQFQFHGMAQALHAPLHKCVGVALH